MSISSFDAVTPTLLPLLFSFPSLPLLPPVYSLLYDMAMSLFSQFIQTVKISLREAENKPLLINLSLVPLNDFAFQFFQGINSLKHLVHA